MVSKYTKPCKLCNQIINIIRERYGTKSKVNKSMQISTSDQGVYFEDSRCWFCNKCWKLLTKDLK